MNMKRISANLIYVLLVFLLNTPARIIASSEGAILVGQESFENVQPGGNIVLDRDLRLRIIGPTTFASGVTLSGPFPQAQLDRAVGVHDCVIACGFGLADNGDIVSPADVPDGSAFFAVDDQDETRPLEFSFPEEMRFVSAVVTGGYYSQIPPPMGRAITLTAFDALGGLIASASIDSVHKDLWSDNKLSITAAGISKITFQGYVYVIDDLRFSTVPEPASSALILAPLFLLANRLRTGKNRTTHPTDRCRS